ncbi:hypothetical protein [Micromonospora sp. NPDC049240]|uniref:hypothetical protein n=1 Tax=Micromonospora sp. NPDC049240 TaxID=3155151 RepID=UPI0033ECDC6A
MTWVITAPVKQIRDELSQVAPTRDRSSDGTVGDLRHQARKSGHNPDRTGNAEYRDGDNLDEVRAVDLDRDLNRVGLTAEQVVAYLVGRCRAGLERRIAYIIFNRTIWSASSGWKGRRYTGSNPHDHHFHISFTAASDTDGRPFGLATLIKEDDTVTPKQFLAILNDPDVARLMRALPWQYVGGGIPTGMSTLKVFNETYLAAKAAAGDKVDEAAIVQGVLAGLSAKQIAEIVATALPATIARQVADDLAARLAA